MKKAKLMLTAIAVLAVVGGALAFKAKTFGQGNVFCKFTDGCALVDYTTGQVSGAETTDNPCAAAITSSTYTNILCNDPKAPVTVYQTEQ